MDVQYRRGGFQQDSANSPKLVITFDPPEAKFNGRWHSLDMEEAIMLNELLGSYPAEVTWKDIVAVDPDLFGKSSKPRRVIDNLGKKWKELAAIIQTKPGKGIFLDFDIASS